MGFWEFIKEYYIDSIIYKEGYNPVNTITFAIILIIAVYLIFRYLSRTGVPFDIKFSISNLPFVILGSSVRVVEDAAFLKPPISYFFMTPFIYVIIFLITFPSLLISFKLRGKDYWRYHATFGAILSLIILIFLFSSLEVINWWVLPLSLLGALIFTILFRLIASRLKRMNDDTSTLVMFAQMTDGFATFLGIQYLGYWELHVLPRFLINTFGPWIMVPAKFFLFLVILYLLDTSDESEDVREFVKFVLMVLGFAPGIRDALRMTFSV
jgi:uncharacterized membrane protein